MLEEIKLKRLKEFIDGYSKEEIIWINGYLAGLVSGAGHPTASPAVPAVKKITLAYGTETGNAKRLATQLAATARQKSVNAKLVGLDQYRLTDLAKEEFFFVVISTQGEGEPPVTAKKFYEFIYQQTLNLAQLKFGVLALGDSSYPMFCKTGEDVDGRLEALGARRVVPLQRCDVDYEEEAKQWFEKVLTLITSQKSEAPVGKVSAPVAPGTGKPSKKIYQGTILNNINLNDRGSGKKTYHIEIGTDEPIAYEPGDTIGIIPRNRTDVVSRIISLTGLDPGKVIETPKFKAGARDLLEQHLNICYLLTSTIKKYAGITGQEIPDTRMDLVDLLRIYPVKDPEQFEEVIKILMPIAPRLYTIASSPLAHGDQEVHITVARDRFLALDEQRYGLCSEFLGDQPANTTINFYVHKDKNFKLPASDKDVIMIGPGTGIAPFRSFLYERSSNGAAGKNWLFFGEQHFVTDFLYQTEIQDFVQTGVLHRLDLAFSRDQAEKIYVQHRMMEHAADLYQWIENGASVFISGTKDPMSKDVEETLLKIIEEQGKKLKDESKQYLEKLKKEGRFEKDVY